MGDDSDKQVVSVVVPTRNRALLLMRALESVLSQSYQTLEVLVIDDGSSDSTPDVAGRFQDSRVRYVRCDEARGGGAARNIGISMATGSYIGFLDDDDVWKPNKISRQLQHIAHCDAVICGYSLITENAELPGTRGRGDCIPITSRVLRKGQVGWGASTFLGRASSIKNVLFDEDLPVGQDWDFLIRFAKRYSIRYHDEPLVGINVSRHARISSRYVNESLADIEKRMSVLRKHRGLLGSFWYRHHEARMLLSRVRERHDRWLFAMYAIRRCGLVPVMVGRFRQTYDQLFGYRY